MADTTNCKQCNTPMRLQALGSVAGEEGVLRIAIADFPVLECERSHRQFIHRDFPAKLLEQVADGGKPGLPAARKQGFLFKKLHCKQCDALLEVEPAPRTFACTAAVDDASLHVELTVPVFVCPACKCEQLRDDGEIDELVPTALAHAFQGAEIRPPG